MLLPQVPAEFVRMLEDMEEELMPQGPLVRLMGHFRTEGDRAWLEAHVRSAHDPSPITHHYPRLSRFRPSALLR